MATLLQFSKNIRRRGRQVENSSARLVRRMARKTLRSIVNNTKVDKGVARSNWRTSAGGTPTAVIPAYVPYPKNSRANGQGINESANASAAIAAGFAVIATVRGAAGAGLKTRLVIANNVPYLGNALVPGAVGVATLEARAAVRGFKVFVDD